MEHHPTLVSVAQAFQHWRNTRTRRGRTPAPLKAQALALLAHHSRSQVISALRINTTTLAAWQAASATVTQTGSAPHATFVELPPWPSAEPVVDAISVTLTGPQGRVITVSGPLTPAHLGALVHGHGETS